ncbi:hypothetical protein [Amycolatopsis sp. NPDC058986]|uniref:hypothetical protein n=1 Tax=unclassified Amycolatopsis TaxID=2618356 RepID=UPI00366C2961
MQPVLVEEITAEDGKPPSMRLAAGERRLRASRWGAVHLPDNPHFAALRAVVCPGPLSDEERRIWQLVENLARESLRPGELVAALVLDRCAVLLGKLVASGHAVPAEVYAIDDPIARFQAMERIRGTDRSCAAPWSEVLSRLAQRGPRIADGDTTTRTYGTATLGCVITGCFCRCVRPSCRLVQRGSWCRVWWGGWP